MDTRNVIPCPRPVPRSHLAIHSAVPAKSAGVMMLVSEATEAAQ